ncbi:signal recognition particle protein [Desulfonauticus submarinus]
MFDSLSERLDSVFKKIKGRGRLDEASIEEGLREVRLALLEADVNYKVVKDFTRKVKEKALGKEVLKSLTPGQQVVKIVHEELIELLGGKNVGLELKGKKPYIIMLVGLQGSGKTTSAAKLALFLRRKKFSPLLVPADVYRPAAIEQLHKLASEINIPSFGSSSNMKPVDIALQAREEAIEKGYDILILDTAGRLHIDEVLMNELVEIKQACSPQEILFVADAMTGQDAVNVASRFDELLDITGVILTKMEGDARGGAALSIKSVTGKPIKFIGVGEKLKDLEVFHPDRIASRILGMGDILTLIEKAQSSIDEKEALKLEEKLKTAKFDLEDFRTQMKRIKKLGSIEGLLKLIPGMGKLRDQLKNVKIPEKEMAKLEAIINSMTKEERKNPKIINASRKERIAKGSGTTVQDVNNLLKNFEQMRKMMQQMMGQMGGGRRLGMKNKKVDRKKLKAKRKKLKKKKKK